jgi:hypothetical protein
MKELVCVAPYGNLEIWTRPFENCERWLVEDWSPRRGDEC